MSDNNQPEIKIDPQRLARLVEIGRELNSKTNLDDLLKLIINEAAVLTGAEAASMLLLDPYTLELRFIATSGEMLPEMANTPVPIDSSIAGAILTQDKPMVIDDVSQDKRWNPQVSKKINFQTGSILGVPMHDFEKPVGVLEAINKRDGRFSDEDVETLGILADLAGVALDKARLFDELQRANRELNELDRLKSDFIAIASHELRTPLSIILGYVTFLKDDADDEMADQLDSVLTAAMRLRELIQDMLNLKYIDTGTDKRDLKVVDLVGLVKRVTDERLEGAQVKNQEMKIRHVSGQLPVLGDADMLEVVIANLVNNAIKFTPEQGNIDIALGRKGKEVWVRVRDTGIGIPEDEVGRIFNRFHQVEPHLSRRFGGMGLGLSIAKELVELHNGRIWAKSTVSEGSEFYVALPAHETSSS